MDLRNPGTEPGIFFSKFGCMFFCIGDPCLLPVQRLTRERAAFWPVSLPTSLHRLALQGFFMALWNGLMLPA